MQTGALPRLLDLIAPDVVLLTDGGGVVRAAVEPVVGTDDVIDALAGLITGLDAVRDPEKLSRMHHETAMAR
ncbi:hypothetical protein [Streptomyces sp. TLI_171]|uniref:hypothetical protein n=1 Tax=Streptomyces sp. TLI_171 TaxID=1938859 RepID=UPI000C19A750|nr:hypothetical protein BX266_7129 [Streptomyces sp. TLI_171]